MNVLSCHGSVKFIKDTINLGNWHALSTMAGGEIVSGDAYRSAAWATVPKLDCIR